MELINLFLLLINSLCLKDAHNNLFPILFLNLHDSSRALYKHLSICLALRFVLAVLRDDSGGTFRVEENDVEVGDGDDSGEKNVAELGCDDFSEKSGGKAVTVDAAVEGIVGSTIFKIGE